MLPRKLKLEGLQAEISAVTALHEQAIEMGDPIGEYQFSIRKRLLENQITELLDIIEKTANVALFFGGEPVLGSRGISANFAGAALEQFQELVSLTFAKNELGVLGERGPIPLQQYANLMVTGIAQGSFGFTLDELSDQTEGSTALKLIVEEAATLIERTASPNELEFEQVAETLDARTLNALKNFFITLDSGKATFRLVEDIIDFTLDAPSIYRARQRTEATSIDETEDYIVGTLDGFLPDGRKFEARIDNSQVVHGSVSKEAVEQYRAFSSSGENPTGKRWKLKIQRRVVRPLNRPPREVNRLLEFLEKN
jgi:hypothetical protein